LKTGSATTEIVGKVLYRLKKRTQGVKGGKGL
jgi:hypothetical protein